MDKIRHECHEWCLVSAKVSKFGNLYPEYKNPQCLVQVVRCMRKLAMAQCNYLICEDGVSNVVVPESTLVLCHHFGQL